MPRDSKTSCVAHLGVVAASTCIPQSQVEDSCDVDAGRADIELFCIICAPHARAVDHSVPRPRDQRQQHRESLHAATVLARKLE